VLPLMKRGKRLFLAVSDPTNLHALDEIRFQTSMSIEFVVVEDDKLQKAVDKAVDQAESVMPKFDRRRHRSRKPRSHRRR
jgi:type IV pilus assembly protein PilB